MEGLGVQCLGANVGEVARGANVYQEQLPGLHPFLEKGEPSSHVLHPLGAVVRVGQHAGRLVVTEQNEGLLELDSKEFQQRFETQDYGGPGRSAKPLRFTSAQGGDVQL